MTIVRGLILFGCYKLHMKVIKGDQTDRTECILVNYSYRTYVNFNVTQLRNVSITQDTQVGCSFSESKEKFQKI